MTLFNQNDDGTGTYRPGEVGVDLFLIVQLNGNLGEEPTGTDILEITFALDPGQTDAPSQRMNNLINTNFGEPPGDEDILIAGVGSGFLIDGTPINNFAGIALPRGAALNPLTMILTLYDVDECNGNTYHVFDTNGDRIAMPRPVLLYHELHHCFEAATGVIPVGGFTDADDLADAETRAMAEENVLRTALGLPLRDPSNHAGGCGAPGDPELPGTIQCCVVASVATGSPFSGDVNSLRHTRDRFLRRTAVGHDFFSRLHHDYYRFSPEICRAMARSQTLHTQVRDLLVMPLVVCLGLVRDYCDAPEARAYLGTRLEEQLRARPALSSLPLEDLQAASSVLAGDTTPLEPYGAELIEATRLVATEATRSETLNWGILHPIGILVQALQWRASGMEREALGHRLADAFDQWAAELPITDFWSDLSEEAVEEHLRSLNTTLLLTPAARAQFRTRLEAVLTSGDTHAC